MQGKLRTWLRYAGRWLTTWPHGRRSAAILALFFWAAGLVATRIDGLAVMDLPYGPVLADGVLTMPAGEVVASVPPPVIAPATPPPVIAQGPPPPLPLPRPVLDTDEPSAPPIEQADEETGQTTPTLVIATEGDYPPFNFVDATGALRGLEIDLVYAVCAELKIACEIVSRRWDELLPGLSNNDYQVVAASMRIPSQPADGVVFSRPYFGSAAAYAAREGDVAARLRGPIGVEANTRMAAYLASRNDNVTIQTYPDAISTYQALVDDQVAAVFDDAVRLNRWLNDPSAACCVMSGQPVFSTEFFGPGVGFALREDSGDLLSKVNQALDQLAEEGRIAELSDRYLPFALN
ncbi:transporter substrate-binding domain-containing protein [Pyruvatibacter sp.]|uniref:transporter substrate-binding domain-containing protein n=1 Tax=Pyruvatibacter sp. TaxID=1981328 RepID=UPI003267EE21